MEGYLAPYFILAMKVTRDYVYYFAEDSGGGFSLTRRAMDATQFITRDAAADYLQSLKEENRAVPLIQMMVVEEHSLDRRH